MSDLDGTDPYIHSGTVEGILGELRNAFVRDGAPPVQSMMAAYRIVEGQLERILTGAGTRNLYAASVFRELCLVALDAVRRTNFQSLAASKAAIDKAQADYEAGTALKQNKVAYDAISAAVAAHNLAVNVMVKHEQLKTRKATAGVLATVQTDVATALADLRTSIDSIVKLYIAGGK
jgi:hypothetical protein